MPMDKLRDAAIRDAPVRCDPAEHWPVSSGAYLASAQTPIVWEDISGTPSIPLSTKAEARRSRPNMLKLDILPTAILVFGGLTSALTVPMAPRAVVELRSHGCGIVNPAPSAFLDSPLAWQLTFHIR